MRARGGVDTVPCTSSVVACAGRRFVIGDVTLLTGNPHALQNRSPEPRAALHELQFILVQASYEINYRPRPPSKREKLPANYASNVE